MPPHQLPIRSLGLESLSVGHGRETGISVTSRLLQLQSDLVVHRIPEALLAAQVSFRRLHGDVPQLDLLKLTARGVTQPGARATTIMERQLGDAGARRRVFHHVPDHLFGNAIAPDSAPSGDAAEDSSFGNRRGRQPAANRGTQSGTGTVRMWAALPTKSTMAQCSSRCCR